MPGCDEPIASARYGASRATVARVRSVRAAATGGSVRFPCRTCPRPIVPTWRPAPRCARLCPRAPLPVGAGAADRRHRDLRFFKVGTWRGRRRRRVQRRSRRCGSPRSPWHPGSSCPSSRSSAGRYRHRRALGQGGRPVVQQGRPARRCCSAAIVLLAILAVSPLLATNYFDGDWVMVVALMRRLRRLRAGPPRPRHLLGHRALPRLRRRHGHRRRWCASSCASPSPSSASSRPAHYGIAVALSPLFGVAYVSSRGNLRTDPGPDAAVGRGHPEPRLAAARLGVRRRPAQRRPDRHHDPRPRRRTLRTAWSPPSPTACCSPASRCSCSRPCRRRCSPASAGSPPTATSSSSAPVSSGCSCSSSPSA